MNIQTSYIFKMGFLTLAFAAMPVCNVFAQKAAANQSVTEFGAVELSWQKRSTEEWSRRVSALARLIGVEVKSEYLAEMLSENNRLGNWQPLRDEKSDLIFKVLPDHNEIRLVNTRLAERIDGLRIEEPEAVKIATEVLQSLGRNDLLNRLRYEPERFKIGYHRVGTGSTDGKQSEQTIVGYRVTFLAHIDNIPLANAGVRIAVHRSGKLSGIRIGGVSVSKGAGKEVSRRVSDDEIQKRFQASLPKSMKPRIAWQRVMYVMPDDERKAVVYPTHTISYSLVGQTEQGEVVSRRKTVGFSLVDSGADITDYLKPAAKHQTTRVSRDAKHDGSLNQRIEEADDHPH